MFRDAGFSLAIWANHLLRAAIPAMQDCARRLAEAQTLVAVEDRVAPVKEIFRLQGASELQAAEERYLPQQAQHQRGIVLAASRGGALGELTEDRPKAMVNVRGRPLLSHVTEAYHAVGIKNISVVRGYLAEAMDLPGLSYVDNEKFAETSELISLEKALAADADDESDLIVSFGDVIFRPYILETLSETDEDFVIAVDTDWQSSVNLERAADFVRCSEPHSRRTFYRRVLLEKAAEDLSPAERHGEWMGILRVRSAAMPRFRRYVSDLADVPKNRKAKLHQLLSALVAAGEPVRVVYTTGNWLDVDTLDDLLAAGSFQ